MGTCWATDCWATDSWAAGSWGAGGLSRVSWMIRNKEEIWAIIIEEEEQ